MGNTREENMLDIYEQWPSDEEAKGWHSAAQPHRGSARRALIRWLKTTDGGRFYDGGTRVWFEREEDCILYTLTWC